jgi:hypothetical protein
MAEKNSALEKSGAQNLLVFAGIVFLVAVFLYFFVTLSLVLYVALVGLAVTLAIAALVELRFYETKVALQRIEHIVEDFGKEKRP